MASMCVDLTSIALCTLCMSVWRICTQTLIPVLQRLSVSNDSERDCMYISSRKPSYMYVVYTAIIVLSKLIDTNNNNIMGNVYMYMYVEVA